MKLHAVCLVLGSIWVCGSVQGGWKAGVGQVDITPGGPAWLAGYAARNRASEGVSSPILVKALALEDAAGRRLVAITCDLLTMPRDLAEPVAARLGARHALPRARILLCASHSHSAPVIRDRLIDMYPLDEAALEQVERYTETVAAALLRAASHALDTLSAARVFTGTGEAGFAINRRRRHPDDPVDHEVPVLRVDFRDAAGEARRAVLFAYACHNTTLSGYQVCGDYAGFAQAALEAAHPGLTALFAAGCAGDQNPEPRRSMELASRHGLELAGAVADVLASSMTPVSPASFAAFGWTPLPLVAAPSRRTVLEQLESDNVYVKRRAARLLEQLDSTGAIDETYAYPAQVWRLGDEHHVVSLAGEVVVDYALRLKREVPRATGAGVSTSGSVVVLAYANDVPGYIPSERVLREGGYEGGGAMLYYGFHGPWAPGVEERVVSHTLSLARQTLEPYPLREPGARLEKLWDGGAFTEGPAWGPDGALYFTDIPNQRILRVRDGTVEEYRRPSGKANGLAFDREGRLIACEGADGGNRRVSRTEKDGAITALAERIDGKRFNSPNDLTVDARGGIYFSDPRYAGNEPRDLDLEAVYRISPAGDVERVLDDVVRPNGLALSPDGEWLYVSDAGARKLHAYRVRADGRLGGKKLVFDFTANGAAPAARGIDGMEVDRNGNIYGAAGRGGLSGVYVLSPAGVLLDFIRTPETATNCCFGEDGRTLFISAGTALYRIRMREKGLWIPR